MKKKFKAFTLIELIIVMAIFGILMAGLMNFFSPIRETYVDSTLYEKQRTAQNGIAEYLVESTKYAEKMAIYDEGASAGSYGTASSAVAAIDAFRKQCFPSYSTMTADQQKKVDGRIHVICINRSDKYDAQGKIQAASDADANHLYTGRLVTCAPVDINNLTDADEIRKLNALKTFDEQASRSYGSGTGYTYLALGGAYYGESNYMISVDVSQVELVQAADENLKQTAASLTFTISNAFSNSGGVVKNGGDGVTISNDDDGSVRVTTENSNVLKNLTSVNYYKVGTVPAGSITPSGSVESPTKNTYIVFVVPDEGDR